MSCINKEVISISDSVWINPSDISTMEYGDYGSYFNGYKTGTIIVMKSGRKVFVKYETPKDILDKIEKHKDTKTEGEK